jgi:hypothetical protein
MSDRQEQFWMHDYRDNEVKMCEKELERTEKVAVALRTERDELRAQLAFSTATLEMVQAKLRRAVEAVRGMAECWPCDCFDYPNERNEHRPTCDYHEVKEILAENADLLKEVRE